MSSTVIYLSNQDVRVLVGSEKGSHVTVDRIIRATAPEGCIINGTVADEEAFTDFFRKFWEKNQLPEKNVTLMLGSAQAVTRLITVPKMSHKKMMEYLPREFASVERTKDPVYGYAVLSQDDPQRRVLVSMVDRSFLKPHIERFRAMGIKLESVDMAMMAEIRALDRLSYLHDKTCMIQMLDGMSLIDILYVEGQYYQFSRSRIFGERGTPAFGVECARSISKQQQFLKTRQIEQEITHIYLGGEFSEEDCEVCRDSIAQMDSTLEVEEIYEEHNGEIRFHVDQSDISFNQFATVAGGLMIPKGKSNLFYQYYRDSETLRRHGEIVRCLTPAVSAAVILGAASCGLGAIWFSRAAQVDSQYDYMENPEVIDRVAQYDILTVENDTLDTRIAVTGRTWDNLESYPVYTSQVKQAVNECAAGLASVEIKSYGAELGTVVVEASSTGEELIHQFVSRLEDRTELFDEIYYEGFDYDDRSGSWKTSVTCYLSGVEMQEEVTAQ